MDKKELFINPYQPHMPFFWCSKTASFLGELYLQGGTQKNNEEGLWESTCLAMFFFEYITWQIGHGAFLSWTSASSSCATSA